MRMLTDFGDLAVVAPLAIVMLVWLASLAGRMTAVIWSAALALCAGTTALLKVYLNACAPAAAALHSPSGHTSLSTFVYGGFVLVIGAEALPWQRILTGAIGAAMITAIAVSRILLQAHSVIEVVIGVMIGAVTLALFVPTYLRHKPARMPLWPLALAATTIALLLHGHEVPAEELLREIAAYFQGNWLICG